MANGAEEHTEAEPSKKSSKTMLIVIIALLLLGGGGAGAYFKFFANSGEGEASVKESEPIVKEMDSFIVNLSDPGGKRFLKVTMRAKLTNQQCMAEFTMRIYEMRDAVLMILAGKEVEDISKPEDRMSLKQELAGAMNKALKRGQVQDIYFTEFLIQ